MRERCRGKRRRLVCVPVSKLQSVCGARIYSLRAVRAPRQLSPPPFVSGTTSMLVGPSGLNAARGSIVDAHIKSLARGWQREFGAASSEAGGHKVFRWIEDGVAYGAISSASATEIQ
jgi:hypothetical protein